MCIYIYNKDAKCDTCHIDKGGILQPTGQLSGTYVNKYLQNWRMNIIYQFFCLRKLRCKTKNTYH